MAFADLSAHAQAEVQRILDSAARRIQAEQVEAAAKQPKSTDPKEGKG